MILLRVSGVVHSPMAFTLPGQPVDCARPLTAAVTRKRAPALHKPKAKDAAAATSMPQPTNLRAPVRSPSQPLAY